MKFTDYTLSRSVWFNSYRIDSPAHKVARDLIKRAIERDSEGYGKLLNIVRRYE